MNRYPFPDLSTLPEDIRARIVEVQEKAGFIPNVFLAFARRPAEWRAFFAYHDALMEREALGSTGLGSGVAVPHARINGLDEVRAVLVRLDTPVAYGAVDDRPVDLLFGLFAPPMDGAQHLRALAAVSRAMRSNELREQLRQARTGDAIHALFVREQPATAA